MKRKLTTKEKFDLRTMRYFLPSTYKVRIYPNDLKKMADLSSKGMEPKRITPGFTALKWGKTYRDEQTTSYKRDVRLGLFTKHEIISSYPKSMQEWIANKIKDVPYDEVAYEVTEDSVISTGKGTSAMLIAMYNQKK